ncbi:MAG: DNA-directed RNA polymerase subunit E'' [Candidatus Heimdallarchaeota archaeon]|nr:DNA-directed RNA polymerase subunit E'' [Candidatus Heimdallarchaeota archaeon]MCK4768903.1 DNA-directed RNA polymerase subunit E'' [Candidatus Heimdallarchaeota archaeon]
MSKACRICHLIVEKTANMCPICKTQDLSSEYTGVVFILKPEDSDVAKRMKISKKGHYALRVR